MVSLIAITVTRSSARSREIATVLSSFVVVFVFFFFRIPSLFVAGPPSSQMRTHKLLSRRPVRATRGALRDGRVLIEFRVWQIAADFLGTVQPLPCPPSPRHIYDPYHSSDWRWGEGTGLPSNLRPGRSNYIKMKLSQFSSGRRLSLIDLGQ